MRKTMNLVVQMISRFQWDEQHSKQFDSIERLMSCSHVFQACQKFGMGSKMV